MELTLGQLYLVRSMEKKGISKSLLPNFMNRCGTSGEEWNSLVDEEFVEEKKDRWWLTNLGKKEYKRQKKGKYF